MGKVDAPLKTGYNRLFFSEARVSILWFWGSVGNFHCISMGIRAILGAGGKAESNGP